MFFQIFRGVIFPVRNFRKGLILGHFVQHVLHGCRYIDRVKFFDRLVHLRFRSQHLNHVRADNEPEFVDHLITQRGTQHHRERGPVIGKRHDSEHPRSVRGNHGDDFRRDCYFRRQVHHIKNQVFPDRFQYLPFIQQTEINQYFLEGFAVAFLFFRGFFQLIFRAKTFRQQNIVQRLTF